MFYHMLSETHGSCLTRSPIPHVVDNSLEGRFSALGVWPVVQGDDFCYEFQVRELSQQNGKLFSLPNFIRWINENLKEEYLLDLYPNNEGLGISGKISTLGKKKPDEVERTSILTYLEDFFAEEDIDVTIS
jgi:hypothetical protein